MISRSGADTEGYFNKVVKQESGVTFRARKPSDGRQAMPAWLPARNYWSPWQMPSKSTTE
jgi:hypothetical protein